MAPKQHSADRRRPDRLGRDAADVAITQTFGPNTLVSFKVWTHELL